MVKLSVSLLWGKSIHEMMYTVSDGMLNPTRLLSTYNRWLSLVCVCSSLPAWLCWSALSYVVPTLLLSSSHALSRPWWAIS